jgi:hypothetical protein
MLADEGMPSGRSGLRLGPLQVFMQEAEGALAVDGMRAIEELDLAPLTQL